MTSTWFLSVVCRRGLQLTSNILLSSNDNAIFAYLRENGNHKVVVILNFSGKAQKFTLTDSSFKGTANNVFLKKKETIDPVTNLTIEPWGFIVYDYE